MVHSSGVQGTSRYILRMALCITSFVGASGVTFASLTRSLTRLVVGVLASDEAAPDQSLLPGRHVGDWFVPSSDFDRLLLIFHFYQSPELLRSGCVK